MQTHWTSTMYWTCNKNHILQESPRGCETSWRIMDDARCWRIVATTNAPTSNRLFNYGTFAEYVSTLEPWDLGDICIASNIMNSSLIPIQRASINNRDFLPGATAQRSMEPTVHSSGSSAQFEDAEWQTEWDDPEDPEWTHTIGQNATECYPYCDSWFGLRNSRQCMSHGKGSSE